MKKQQLIETVRRVIKKSLKEDYPQPQRSEPKEDPAEKPGTIVHPGKPSTGKPKPRRPLGNPNVKPKPKATMIEAEMLAKIIKRFKSKKSVNEDANDMNAQGWQQGYKEGYMSGYADALSEKENKFNGKYS